MKELPIYKIKGKYYFLDKRLNEYRNIDNPNDSLNFNSVSLEMLEKPIYKDRIKIKALYFQWSADKGRKLKWH